MHLLSRDFKKGIVKLKVTSLEDLWYLSQLLDPGDLLTGKTTRKIKLGEGVGTGEQVQVVKKTLTLTIEVEEVELTETSLRAHGKVKKGPEDVPRDSYHTITLEESSECTIEKVEWLSYQKQKLEEAAQRKFTYLLCVFDREEALFAITKAKGFDILVKLQGEAQKKRHPTIIKKEFWEEMVKAIEVYAGRYAPERIIVASPAFYKEEVLKRIHSSELKQKIVLASCSDVSERALDEVLTRPELARTLQSSRTRQEQLLVDELLKEINKGELAVYGWKEVQRAVQAGAVRMILLTDAFIRQRRLAGRTGAGSYGEVDELLKAVDRLQGEIHIISIEHEGGKRLAGLGSIAALLRYKVDW
ncbi:MAG: mRNA surveillance protein pelota [Nanoarchaeota archaeon]